MAAFRQEAGGGSSSKIGRQVRFRGQSGKHLLVLSFRGFNPRVIRRPSLDLLALVTDCAMEAWYHPPLHE